MADMHMNDLQTLLDALKDLDNADPDIVVQSIHGLIEAVVVVSSRLVYLNTWLESRGLPLDWTGPLNAWAWVVRGYSFDGTIPWLPVQTGKIIGIVHQTYQPTDFAIRWDHATPEQRAEALRIEASKING